MSFFGRLARSLLGRGDRPADASAGANAFWLYVQCTQCDEKIRVRVNREHDLSAEFDGGDLPSSYYVHKEVIGHGCFRRIKVDLHFDGRRILTEQKIEGGAFITQAQYDAPEPSQANGDDAP